MEKRGDVLFRTGDSAGAQRCWEQVLADRPASASARNKLAILCMQVAHYAEARVLLEEGIRLNANVSSFHFNQGLLEYMDGRHDAALRALAEAERLGPGQSNVHYVKGVIYEALGQKDLARREFVEELNVDPATPRAWVQLGVLPEGSQIMTWLRK